ncbi:MAG: transcriptional repressor [Anaerolineae bacterium]|nr:transcriptional repressor [Anaerolineae bacterium]
MTTPLQLTRQREAILTVIQEAEKHLTAQEIYDRVRQRLPGIAYATVYNALAYLFQAGQVQALHLGSGATLYDRNLERHDHLVCRQCGKVLDYCFPDLNRALEEVTRATGFRAQKVELTFVGLCPDCQAVDVH